MLKLSKTGSYERGGTIFIIDLCDLRQGGSFINMRRVKQGKTYESEACLFFLLHNLYDPTNMLHT